MRKMAISAALLAAAAASPALAAGATGQSTTVTVDVSLNVSTACSVTTYAMPFGTQTSVTGGATAVSGTTVKCTPGAAYVVYVNNGQNAGAGTQRHLNSAGGAHVDYDVFSDSTRSTAWPTTGVGGTGNGGDQNMYLYGQLTQATEVASGAYTDQLTVTLDY